MERIVILDGLRGIYIPAAFFQMFKDQDIIYPDKSFLSEIRTECADPENGDYWETWLDFVREAHVQIGNTVYELEEDNDLFGIPVPSDCLYIDTEGNTIVLR